MRANLMKLVTATLLMLVGGAAIAQETRWVVRGLGVYFATADDDSPVTATQPPPLGEETTRQSVESAAGFGISMEYLWRDRIGIDGAAFLSYHDVDMTITNDLGTFAATDSTRFRTFAFGVNYHFEPEGRARWSVGGFVPLMFADGTDHVFPDLDRTEGRAYDQDYGLGVKAGMDWRFAPDSPWTLSVEARYLFLLIMESEKVGDIDVDPAVVTAGIGYRF